MPEGPSQRKRQDIAGASSGWRVAGSPGRQSSLRLWLRQEDRARPFQTLFRQAMAPRIVTEGAHAEPKPRRYPDITIKQT